MYVYGGEGGSRISIHEFIPSFNQNVSAQKKHCLLFPYSYTNIHAHTHRHTEITTKRCTELMLSKRRLPRLQLPHSFHVSKWNNLAQRKQGILVPYAHTHTYTITHKHTQTYALICSMLIEHLQLFTSKKQRPKCPPSSDPKVSTKVRRMRALRLTSYELSSRISNPKLIASFQQENSVWSLSVFHAHTHIHIRKEVLRVNRAFDSLHIEKGKVGVSTKVRAESIHES